MSAATIFVSSASALQSALAKAVGGETILLQGGNYGSLAITSKSGYDISFEPGVTIASADPENPAVFTSARVQGASNLTFDGVTFDYTFKAGDIISARPFEFIGCKDLALRDCTFDGDVAGGVNASSDGYGWGTGLYVHNSSDVLIEGSEFSTFYRGAVIGNVTNLKVLGNDIHSMRSDGMDFCAVQKVLIEGNHFHDFAGSGAPDHRDMIQFWTTGTTRPSVDVTIRSNLLDVGEGTATQSIFMRNELVDTGVRSFADMAYRNILIEDNTIINGHAHGITVGPTAGLQIRQNSVFHADGKQVDGPDSPVEIPRINVHELSTGVSVIQNATGGISPPSKAGWTIAQNVIVQDQNPKAPNYYGDVFVGSSWLTEDGDYKLMAAEGGVLQASGAGSTLTRSTPTEMAAMFHIELKDTATRIFDATHCQMGAYDLPPGTRYLWSFGDGTTAEGLRVEHAYAAGGSYGVTLTVRLPDGRVDDVTVRVPVQNPEVLRLDGRGHFTSQHDGLEENLAPLANFKNGGLQLGAAGVSASVGRGHVKDVVGADEMTLDFSLIADKRGASGELFRLHGSFAASVTSTGELVLRAWQQDGSAISLVTKGAHLNSGREHDVVLHLGDGKLQAWVDGALVGETKMLQPIGGATGFGSHNLIFGNPWGDANFKGDLLDFGLAVGGSDFPQISETVVLVEAPLAPVLTVEDILTLTPSGFVAFDDGQPSYTLAAPAALTADGLQLGAKGSAATIARQHVVDVVGDDDLNLSFKLDADRPGTSGEVFRMHGSFTAAVNKQGELIFRLYGGDQNETVVATKGAALNTGAKKDVSIDLRDGKLEISVDGSVLGSADAPGIVGGAKGFGSHGLTFGNPWGKENFRGDISDFHLSNSLETLTSRMEPEPREFAPLHQEPGWG